MRTQPEQSGTIEIPSVDSDEGITPPESSIDAGELHLIDITLSRLSKAFYHAVQRVRGTPVGGRALARAIDSDIALCHRVLAGIQGRGELSDRLAAWPGVSGVRAVAERTKATLGDVAVTLELERAVAAYSELIDGLGGTQTKLVRRLQENAVGDRKTRVRESDVMAAKRQMFRSMSKILGYTVDVVTMLRIVRPCLGRPEFVEGVNVGVKSGIRCTTHPMQLKYTSMPNVRMEADPQYACRSLGDLPAPYETLLSEFCSHPLPRTSCEHNTEGMLSLIVDPMKYQADQPKDIAHALHWVNIRNQQYAPTPLSDEATRVHFPSRAMVFDVYVHRTMVLAKPPTMHVLHPTFDTTTPAEQNWANRVPILPRIELLQHGAGAPSTCEPWERMSTFTTRIFERVGWERSEYVGYRCIELFPLYGVTYSMAFEYVPPQLIG